MGACCSGFRSQLETPFPPTTPSLVSSSEVSVLYQRAFFHTCFCAAVFPSVGGTTLLAVVLVCFRNLCWAPATCQTHTDGSGCEEWQWRVLDTELVTLESQIKIYCRFLGQIQWICPYYSSFFKLWVWPKTVDKVQFMLSNIGFTV